MRVQVLAEKKKKKATKQQLGVSLAGQSLRLREEGSGDAGSRFWGSVGMCKEPMKSQVSCDYNHKLIIISC